jgi:hypothetical protein
MKKIIKAFKNLSETDQQMYYTDYFEGLMERTVFPYNGGLEEGAIYKTDDCIYLIPISSIVQVKSSSSKEEIEFDNDDFLEMNEDEIQDEE